MGPSHPPAHGGRRGVGSASGKPLGHCLAHPSASGPMKYRLRESSGRNLQGQCPLHDILDTEPCSFCTGVSSNGALAHSPGSQGCGEGKEMEGRPAQLHEDQSLGNVHSLIRKPRQLGMALRPPSSCLTLAPSHFSPTATRNPHPGHPQEPMEHGREPHAHQVSETSHLCAALPHIWEHLPPQSTCSLGSGLLLPLTPCSLLLLLSPCRAGAGWGLVSGAR